MKGQRARGQVKAGFEGGQTPLHRRTPKAKGFRNPFRVEYVVVNLDALERLRGGFTVVVPTSCAPRGLVAKRGLVKILGRGEISKGLTVKAHGFSGSAKQAIESAGGSTEVLPATVGRSAPAARQQQRADEPLG